MMTSDSNTLRMAHNAAVNPRLETSARRPCAACVFARLCAALEFCLLDLYSDCIKTELTGGIATICYSILRGLEPELIPALPYCIAQGRS